VQSFGQDEGCEGPARQCFAPDEGRAGCTNSWSAEGFSDNHEATTTRSCWADEHAVRENICSDYIRSSSSSSGERRSRRDNNNDENLQWATEEQADDAWEEQEQADDAWEEQEHEQPNQHRVTASRSAESYRRGGPRTGGRPTTRSVAGPFWESRSSVETADAESRSDRWYHRSVEADYKSHWKWQGPVNARHQAAGAGPTDKLNNSASNTWKWPSSRNATRESDGAIRQQGGSGDSMARPRFQRPVKRH